ncbi:MAG: 30S ribosomal protein S2 [Candidatus Jorgensenbacteria bacterium]|nr:30S ribosomal protein S2 [Candidatus Jorgensenbacteria bacterium]
MTKEKEMTSEIVSELVSAGVIAGHKRSKTHPKMKPFIALNRNEIDFLDPDSTISSIDDAVEFIAGRLGPEDFMLCIGTTVPARETLLAFAEHFQFPYVITRWLGGTLTNFKVINDRMKYYVDLKAKKEKGELDKYTKKEQLKFSEKIIKLSVSFDGLLKMTKLPAIVFVIDPAVNDTVVKEAKLLKIPVVAILDTNDNPKEINKPIFANDHTKQSIEWVMNKIKTGVDAAKIEMMKKETVIK